MKSLVIAEKPSVARDIARVLHCTQKGNGTLEGKDYVVTWALGHLVTLADPEEYDKKYMKWEISTLPMMPDRMKLVVIRQTGKQYNVVKTQLYRKDINDIIIATDAGREGELVARWILDKADCHKPIRRLWISSVTDKAIKEGFGNLKNGHEYDNLYRAAVARAEADWLVGMNGTRALTCKYNAQLSCGRVQTPTLAMIAKREEEIRAFKPKEYYGITLKAGDITWTWKEPKSKSFRTFNKERAEEISDVLRNQSLEVTSVTSKEKKSFAPGLYDLTTLQREANRKYGYSAKQTLNIMQRLYENHKVLTYPRTDSRYIGKDIVPTIKVNPSPSVNPTVTPVPTVAPIPDTYPEGTEKDKNGNLVTPEGIVISSDGTVTLPDGTELTPDADGKKPTVNKDETVTDTKGNTYSTDGSITDSDGNYTRPAKAVIKNVSVSKNSVKMVLNEECKGALKYDYVIGTSEDMLKTGQYTKVLKNQEELKSAFAYMDKGTWYVACHAWFKGEDGKKVFGQWSEIHQVDVSTITPQTPVISKVTVKGSTVTVKYTKSKNSQGYDVVLSDTLTRTNGQKRPAVSGENYYVKKIKGNTVTVTFKNVKSGTYYIGLHAWNRTSEDNSKTFSEWSNVRKVKMK